MLIWGFCGGIEKGGGDVPGIRCHHERFCMPMFLRCALLWVYMWASTRGVSDGVNDSCRRLPHPDTDGGHMLSALSI